MVRQARDRSRQGGQAAAEFAVAASLLVFMLALIPWLGHWLGFELAVQKAAAAVMWERVRSGNATSDQAQAASILLAWRQQRLPGLNPANPGELRVVSNREDDHSFAPVSPLRDALDLSTGELAAVDVTWRVDHPLAGVALGPMTLHARQAGLGNPWTAAGPGEVVDRIEGAALLHPYHRFQRPVVRGLNRLLALVFAEPEVGKSLVLPDQVPADRLQPYAP